MSSIDSIHPWSDFTPRDIAGQRGGIRPGCLISILVVGVLMIGGSIGGYYWVKGLMEDQAELAVQDDPVLEEHIGTIQEIDLNWGAMGSAEENQGEKKDKSRPFFVFDLVGSKGSGRLTIAMEKGGEKGMTFSDGSLTMDDGKRYTLETTKSAPKQDPPDAESEKDEAGPAPKKDAEPAPKK